MQRNRKQFGHNRTNERPRNNYRYNGPSDVSFQSGSGKARTRIFTRKRRKALPHDRKEGETMDFLEFVFWFSCVGFVLGGAAWELFKIAAREFIKFKKGR